MHLAEVVNMIQNSLTLNVRLRQFHIWIITVQGVLTARGLHFQRARYANAHVRVCLLLCVS